MHQLQKLLLKRLSVQNNQHYGTLTFGYDFQDNVVFHLNRLLATGLIEKQGGIYSITISGIKMIEQYELNDLDEKGIKTFFVGLVCRDNNDNYLIKAHPCAQTHFYNLPSGKPFFGESMNIALPRILKANTDLDMDADNFAFTSLHLKTITTSQGEILFDEAFTIYSIRISDDQKANMKLTESLSWKSAEEIANLPNRWPEIDRCVLRPEIMPYVVYTHQSDYIL